MRIEWTDKFRAGVEKFDSQHKGLIELINELQRIISVGGGSKELEKVVTEIYEHKKNHFADEERLMLDHNYPEFEQHAKEHREMLDWLSRHRENLAAGDKMATVELSGYLSDWLMNHVAKTDMQYGQFFNDRGVY
ncbi:hypothetical protein MNBD_NITROSPINAE04-2659 [hydrothermal vent metagenome]|uniref:Hemerythrin-like domain-containing protein n=1 Tax=hydrothermal vent metagenome TaxID=652676 RepID=A0A3B1CP58_9ZZZZ